MTRTTLDLDASILAELRRRGRRERKSMGQVASEALAIALREPARPVGSPLRWRSRHMGMPRIDIDDKHALAAAFDEEYLARLRR
ncbi:MAG: antitoxin [Solirubrobacteraceae bacterium]